MHFVEEVILIEKKQNRTKAVDISIHLSAAQLHMHAPFFFFHLSHFRDTLTHDESLRAHTLIALAALRRSHIIH